MAALKFADRLRLAFVSTVAASALITLGAVLAMRGVGHSVAGLVDDYADNLLLAERLIANVERYSAATRAYLLTRRPMHIKRAGIARRAVGREVDALEERLRKNSDLERVDRAIRDYEEMVDRAIAMRRRSTTEGEVVGFFDTELQPRREALVEALDEFVQQRRESFVGERARVAEVESTVMALVVVFASLVVLSAGAVGAMSVRTLTRAHETVGRALRARDMLIATASHELKNPLAALTLQVEWLARHADVATRATVERVRRQTQLLTRLVENLLDASRVATGRMDLSYREVDLAALVRDIAGREKEELERAGCELRLAVPPSVTGTWDELRLEQVVTNLLSNGKKYGAGKPLDLGIETTEERAVLTVADRGIGIAPEDRDRIFKPFERATAHHESSSFGLGLWITSEIVRELGGTIRVDSELGRGSTFRVELPLRRAPR